MNLKNLVIFNLKIAFAVIGTSVLITHVDAQVLDEFVFESPPFSRGFGEQMDISGDWMVVGMPFASRNVGGNTQFCHGRADFVKRQTDGSWIGMQEVFSPVTTRNLGVSVSIDENTAVIGSLFEGNEIYVYALNGDEWTFNSSIQEPGINGSFDFGGTVELNGDRLAVTNGSIAGNARLHMYERQDGVWAPDGIINEGAAFSDGFGLRMEMEGDRLIVTYFINNTLSFVHGHIYERMGPANWQRTADLYLGGNGGFQFGVGLSGDTAVMVRPNTREAGIFELQQDGTWEGAQTLTASLDDQGQGLSPLYGTGFFAHDSVVLEDDFLAIGEPYADVDGIVDAGAVYIYQRNPDGVWEEIDIRTGTETNERYGGGLALNNRRLAIGRITILPNDGGCPLYPDDTNRVDFLTLGAGDLGDVNCDGEVNLLDVAPFVELLSTGGFSEKADINQDGALDLLDIEPFVALLSGN